MKKDTRPWPALPEWNTIQGCIIRISQRILFYQLSLDRYQSLPSFDGHLSFQPYLKLGTQNGATLYRFSSKSYWYQRRNHYRIRPAVSLGNNQINRNKLGNALVKHFLLFSTHQPPYFSICSGKCFIRSAVHSRVKTTKKSKPNAPA